MKRIARRRSVGSIRTVPSVRITAFPAYWLAEKDSFANITRITWSTGKLTRKGDIQLFAVSTTLGHRPDLANDPRRDAVHSIWKALTGPLDEYKDDAKWPIQANFKLLTMLECPVPKADLVVAGLLKRAWPQSSAGKLLRSSREIKLLADLLMARNPTQRAQIHKALFI